MDLGSATLRGNGTNLLQNAIHSRHGLVWTDGKAIYLAPVRLFGEKIESANSNKLGEFDYVHSVHWSADIDRDTCFLCVVHQRNVSVWRVSGNGPKLGFKQVRKINVQPIPQGILWNPGREILCLLSRQQCSFYFKHNQSKSSYAFPQLESGKFACGSWSEDGRRLVVCTGSILLIYTWSDIDTSINDFTPAVWKIPQVDGSLTSLCPISKDAIVCVAELPLEELCKDSDTFLVPDVVSSSEKAALLRSESDVIQPSSQNSSSLKDGLLNLPKNPQAMLHDTAQLIVIKFRENLQDPEKISSTCITRLLAPDILSHERNSDLVVLGSSTQSVLQVFAFIDSQIVKVSDIQLDKNHRPKGASRVPAIFSKTNTGVLIMVGEKEARDAAFLSTTNESQYHLSLMYFPLKIDKSLVRHSYSGMPSVQSTDINSLQAKSLSGSLIIPKSNDNHGASVPPRDHINISAASNREQLPRTNLVCDMDPSKNNGHLETETTQFSSQVPRFKNPHFDKNSETSDRLGDVSSGLKNAPKQLQMVEHSSSKSEPLEDSLSDAGNGSSTISSDSSCENIEQQIKSQKQQIEELQKKISELTQVVEDTACIFPTKYQSPQNPEKVKVCCQYLNGSQMSRSFLLDNGRLQLEPIKQAFGLATVELIIDGEPCVLGMNIDGYIPMKFTPSSTLNITGLSTTNFGSVLIKEDV